MELNVRVRPTQWLGRTVYRAYYQAPNGRWTRFGRYEGATAEIVKQQVMASPNRGAAKLVWKD